MPSTDASGASRFARGAVGALEWPAGPADDPPEARLEVTTILVIDDSSAARVEIRGVLEQSGLFARVLEAADGLAGLRLLLAESIDVVLCDLEMPGLDGEKVLRAQRARPGADAVPFFFLTAERDPDRMARLLRAGAADTVTKPFHPAELLARLETHLRLQRLQAELREKNAMLEHLSTTDSVTGLRTRRYVGEALSLELLRATRYRTPLAVAMADLDHFKQVNDTWGHPAGDAVLRDVSQTVLGVLRGTDIAGRYGGEEILLVLPQTDLEGAAALAERVRVSIEERRFDVGNGQRIALTASLGVAALAQVPSVEALVQAADAALYEAKEAGRNRVVAADPRAADLDRPFETTRSLGRLRRSR
jgi:two-component system cell cycle response regulator